MPARPHPDEPRDSCGMPYSERTHLGLEDVMSHDDLLYVEEWDWGGLSDDDGEGPPDGGGGSASVGAGHDVTIYPPPGEHEGNEDRYELGCARCEYLGSADTFADAEAIARLHEGFVALLVDRWEVPE